MRCPQEPEGTLVDGDSSTRLLVQIVRRGADPDDPQRGAPLVDQRRQRVARRELVHLGEPAADQHLVLPGRREHPPAHDAHEVDALCPLVRGGHADEPPGPRAVEPGDVEPDVLHHARLDPCDARHHLEPRAHVVGRAGQRREDVGEMPGRVVLVARPHERARRPADRHDGEHAPGEHERDRRHLRPRAPEVAQQLPVERPHGAALRSRARPLTTPAPRARCAARCGTPRRCGRSSCAARGPPCRRSPRCA